MFSPSAQLKSGLRAALQSRPEIWRLARDCQTALKGPNEIEIEMLGFLVPRDRVAIDVGANVGRYTHALRKIASRVIALEPNPDYARELQRVYGQQAKVINAAASDRRETVSLRMPANGAGAGGLATIASENSLGDQAFRSIEVSTLLLSDFVEEDVGFIKVDVEGHELAVLRGADMLLRRRRPTILVEAEERHRPQAVQSIRELLEPLGYRGLMVSGRTLRSIESFDLDRDQGLSPEEADGLDRGVRPARYINNFIFLP